MIHKLEHITDLDAGMINNDTVRDLIEGYLTTYDSLYGEDRNVDEDDGGYVLYCDPGTSAVELKSFIDYEDLLCEYTQEIEGTDYLQAMFILNNEYVVFVVMTKADMPKSLKELMI